MPSTWDPDDWRAVADCDGFVRYLDRVRQDLVGVAPDDGSIWAARTAPDFFYAWASWIDAALADRTHPDLLAVPSWTTVAGKLGAVRIASPGPRLAATERVHAEDHVTSPALLANGLRHLGDDCLDDAAALRAERARGAWAVEGRWAHGTDLAAYLEAWHACMVDNRSIGVSFTAASWPDLARLLTLGRIYE